MEAGPKGCCFPSKYLWGHQSSLGFSLWRKKNFFLVQLFRKIPCNIRRSPKLQKVHGKFGLKTILGNLLGGPVLGTLPFNVGGVGSIPGQGAGIPHALGPQKQNINRGNIVANSMKSLKKKKTILICKRENLFCESELWWGKKLVNLMCGLLKTTGDLVSTPYPLLVSDTLSTSCLVPVPVFVELCCIFFQTCLQVLLSHVTFAGFYKTKSAFIKRNIKKQLIPSRHLSLHTRFAFGVMVGVYFFLLVLLFICYFKRKLHF